jgi:hypothetical protein
MKRALAVALAVVQVTLCLAAGAADDFSVGVAGLRRKWYAVPTGLDLKATYKGLTLVEGLDTILFAKAGGGYEDRLLFRDPSTGEPYADRNDTSQETQFGYVWADFQWELAFIQGILPKEGGGNLLEAFAYYRGRFDTMLEGAGTTPAFPDWDGLFYTGFMGGLSWNGLGQDRHGVKSGIYAEASAEWGPGFLNADLADFWRISAEVSGALPLFDLPGERNVLSAYLADFVAADYADGTAIPAYVNQSFGGRDLRDSLGTCVRGYAFTAYDTKLKAVNNLELRLNGPAFGSDRLYPVAYAFLDSGYYQGYSGAIAAADDSGCLASVGGGFALNILDIAQLGIAVAWPLAEKTSFWWSAKLFLHF